MSACRSSATKCSAAAGDAIFNPWLLAPLSGGLVVITATVKRAPRVITIRSGLVMNSMPYSR